jgi:hypothetical protein
MKKFLTIFALGLALAPTCVKSQPMGHAAPSGPDLNAATAKLFGDHQSFSANLEFTSQDGTGRATTIPGKISFDDGKSRFEMNLTTMKGSKMPPQAAAQMKAMGMDSLVSISRPDKSVVYIVYPGLQGYVENPLTKGQGSTNDFQTSVTALGHETVDGHDCEKNKVVITDKEGQTNNATVWNAVDLEKFPLKIETTEEQQTVTMHFTEVSMKKPDAANFEPPTGLTKYDSVQALVQTQMMKKMQEMRGGMGAMPPQ